MFCDLPLPVFFFFFWGGGGVRKYSKLRKKREITFSDRDFIFRRGSIQCFRASHAGPFSFSRPH